MKIRFCSIALLCLTSVACTEQAKESKEIRLATTTSTYNSGLLDYLLPKYEQETGYVIDVIAVGTGKALKMGENGDVDLVMTHAPVAESEFINKGFGIEPHHIMYNDFVIVGPKNDPANINNSNSVTQALTEIAKQNQVFISRGDDSGTEKKEKALWKAINVSPTFSAYRSIGQGMGATLYMASELQGYTLTDRGTWLAYQEKLDLDIVFEGDKTLTNPYQVILVNPKRYTNLNTKGARNFSQWLISAHGQELINSYQINGTQLFTADYGRE